jgi:uncharacterized membrane protein HdeD (DUF308 family)
MNGLNESMADTLHRGWLVLLLRGIAAIAFGLLAWSRPGVTLAAIVFLFGAYVLFDGILATWTAISRRKEQQYWWLLLLGGLAGIAIGVLTFTSPHITALLLLFYIAAWAIIRGVFEIAAAIRLRKEIEGEWLLIISGAISVLFGILLLARPGAGVLAVLWLISIFAITTGILLVMLAFKVRGLGKQVEAGAPPRP